MLPPTGTSRLVGNRVSAVGCNKVVFCQLPPTGTSRLVGNEFTLAGAFTHKKQLPPTGTSRLVGN